MERPYLRCPEDRKAAVFYGLALEHMALPTDKTYANQTQGGGDPNRVSSRSSQITLASSTI